MNSVFHKGRGHEVIMARGEDLQERERLLVEVLLDALAVLPVEPGNWDEVRDVSTLKGVLLHSLHLVDVWVNLHLMTPRILKKLYPVHCALFWLVVGNGMR